MLELVFFVLLEQDGAIRGVTIPKDSYFFQMLNEANLDAEMFAQPEVFDIFRAIADENLTLGFGQHSCLGKTIGHLEVRVASEELFKRIPRFSISEENVVSAPALTAANVMNLKITCKQ